MSVANRESFGLPPDGSVAWNPLNESFQNPWFERAWIAQEFAVSPQLAMAYGDQTLLPDFADKVRAASLQHGLGHYLMSGNPASEIGPTESRKAMDKSWMAAQTEILFAERFFSRSNGSYFTPLLRLTRCRVLLHEFLTVGTQTRHLALQKHYKSISLNRIFGFISPISRF